MDLIINGGYTLVHKHANRDISEILQRFTNIPIPKKEMFKHTKNWETFRDYLESICDGVERINSEMYRIKNADLGNKKRFLKNIGSCIMLINGPLYKNVNGYNVEYYKLYEDSSGYYNIFNKGDHFYFAKAADILLRDDPEQKVMKAIDLWNEDIKEEEYNTIFWDNGRIKLTKKEADEDYCDYSANMSDVIDRDVRTQLLDVLEFYKYEYPLFVFDRA